MLWMFIVPGKITPIILYITMTFVNCTDSALMRDYSAGASELFVIFADGR